MSDFELDDDMSNDGPEYEDGVSDEGEFQWLGEDEWRWCFGGLWYCSVDPCLRLSMYNLECS